MFMKAPFGFPQQTDVGVLIVGRTISYISDHTARQP
jgi:hypothetical protein